MVETKNNKNKKRISPTGTAAIGALIIQIGVFFLSYNYIQSMKIYAYDNMADAIYTEDEDGEADEMGKAMLEYCPIRTLRSFNGVTNEQIKEILEALKKMVLEY